MLAEYAALRAALGVALGAVPALPGGEGLGGCHAPVRVTVPQEPSRPYCARQAEGGTAGGVTLVPRRGRSQRCQARVVGWACMLEVVALALLLLLWILLRLRPCLGDRGTAPAGVAVLGRPFAFGRIGAAEAARPRRRVQRRVIAALGRTPPECRCWARWPCVALLPSVVLAAAASAAPILAGCAAPGHLVGARRRSSGVVGQDGFIVEGWILHITCFG